MEPFDRQTCPQLLFNFSPSSWLRSLREKKILRPRLNTGKVEIIVTTNVIIILDYRNRMKGMVLKPTSEDLYRVAITVRVGEYDNRRIGISHSLTNETNKLIPER